MTTDVTVTAAEARQTPWFKRNKAERQAVYVERQAALALRHRERMAKLDAKSAGQPTMREILSGRCAVPDGAVTAFAGVALFPDSVQHKGQTMGLPARATVETAGQLQSRVTVTRLLTTGIFAFGLKKKRDDRELYLTVEGAGEAFVVKLDPKRGHEARVFAAKVNSAR